MKKKDREILEIHAEIKITNSLCKEAFNQGCISERERIIKLCEKESKKYCYCKEKDGIEICGFCFLAKEIKESK